MGSLVRYLKRVKGSCDRRRHVRALYREARAALSSGTYASQCGLHQDEYERHGHPKLIGDAARCDAGERRCFLIDAANHSNIGDLAISLSEIAFLERYFEGPVFLVCQGEFWEDAAWLEDNLRPNDLIVMHGGGNMGDLYAEHEMQRCAVIDRFPDARVIVMPQTIDYLHPDSPVLELSKRVYGRASRLTVFARENRSAELMAACYPGVSAKLVPDIVVSGLMVPVLQVDRERARRGVLLALRNDWECGLSVAQQEGLARLARSVDGVVAATDTVTARHPPIPSDAWDAIVLDKLNEFAVARAIITDRLHGMVLAALAGTPCVVLSNSNHKVRGVYEWLKSLGYIKYVETPGDVPAALDAVLACKDCSYLPPEQIEAAFAPLIEALA